MSKIGMRDKGILNKKMLFVLGIAIALGISVNIIKTTAQQPQPYIFRGFVKYENGTPVANALVRLQDMNTGIIKETYTDTNGSYSVTFTAYGDSPECYDGDWLVGRANDSAGYQGTNDTHFNFSYIGNPPHWFNFTIDTPITTKHLIGGVCERGYYIRLDTIFNFTATDELTGVNKTFVRIWYNGSWHPEPGTGKGKNNNFWIYGEDIPDNFTLGDFDWAGGGLYYIEYYSNDLNGSEEYTHNQTHYIDMYPPTYTVEFGKPNATIQGLTAINCSTPMWINATDNESGALWVNISIWWNETQPGNYKWIKDIHVKDNEEGDEDPTIGNISVKIIFNEGCFHEIKWFVEDCVGHRNPSDGQKSMDIAVDCTPPIISHSVGKPNFTDSEGRLWISCKTPVWFNASDVGCGGGAGVWKLGIVVLWNKTQINGTQELHELLEILVEDGGPVDADGKKDGNISFKMHFWQDCFHEPEIWAEDYVGNIFKYKTRFLVDCTPPNVTKKIINEYVKIKEYKEVDQQTQFGYNVTRSTIFFEDFENGSLGWTIEEGASPNGDTWALNNEPDWTSACVPGGASGAFMEFDDDDYDSDSDNPLEYLISPVIDCTGYENVTLDFDGDFQDMAGYGWFRVDVTNDNGITWHTVLFETEDVNGWNNYPALPLDISSYADGKKIMIRFVYSDLDETNTSSGWGWGCLVDNINVTGEKILCNCHQLSNELWKDYQSFKPSIDYLDAISLVLCGPGEENGTITVSLYNSNYELIASNTTMLGKIPSAPAWYQFHFEHIKINPGQTYYIVVTTSYNYYWGYVSCNETFHCNYYVKGCGRMDGYLYDENGKPFDWLFKTEYYPIDSFVNTSSIFNLTVRDEGCMGGVGLNKTFGIQYRIWLWNESSKKWELIQNWTKYTGNFTLNEECTHRIEIMAKDLLGNTYHYNQTHHVDESPPKIFKKHFGCHEALAGGLFQPLNESFEDVHAVHPFPPAGWIRYNKGDDEHGITWMQWVYDSQHGGYSAACHAGGKLEFQDEWLVTPRILMQENPVFSFWHKAVNGTQDNAPNEIWITTTGDTINDFLNNGVKLMSWLGDLPNEWTQVILDDELLPYVNKSVWIAFRYQSTDGEIWMIDNVTCTGLVSVGRYMQPWDKITLEVRDMPTGECAVGLNFTEIFWRYEYEGELRPYGIEDPLNYYYGIPVIGKDGLWWWHTYDNITNITFYEECRHDLYYYYNASDLLGNTINSTIYHQVYYVDQSEPIIEQKIHPPCYWPIVTNETIFYENMEGVIDSPPHWISDGYPVPNYGWTQYEINATGMAGYWTYDTSTYHSPTKSAYHHNDTTYDPQHPIFDDWLITPLIKLPNATEIELVFWEKNDLMDRYMHHGVYISLAGKNPDPNGDGHIDDGNYSLLAEFNEPTDWIERHVDLSAYAGHAVYIAFRYMGNNSSRWWIDDVEIRAATENPGFIQACSPIFLQAKDYPEAKAIDQSQEEWDDWMNIQNNSIYYAQTFTAGAEQLDAIELYLGSDYETNVTVVILQGTPLEWWIDETEEYILGYVTKHIPPIGNESSPVWWQFHFVPSINLVVGEQYTIVAFSDYPCFWAYASSDEYPGGCAWILNETDGYEKNETVDFAFRTEYWTGEPSICKSGIQHIFYKYHKWNESSQEWEEHPSAEEENNPNVINITQFYTEDEIWYWMGEYIYYYSIEYPYLWYIYNETNGIHFYENCTHRLYYWAKDNVCHHSAIHIQTYYVDDEKPIVEKEHPEHGYYTPVNITVYPEWFVNYTGKLEGVFHVAAYWETSYPDGWEHYPPEDYYKKQEITFNIINNDLNHTLYLTLYIEEIYGDDGITFLDPYVYGPTDENHFEDLIIVGPGNSTSYTVTVYDWKDFWRMGVWKWWAKVENVTQYLRACARINLTAYDPPGYKEVDQQQTNYDASDSLQIYSPPPLWDAQEFTANATRLDAVELLLSADEGGNVTVTILDDPIHHLIPLGKSTLYIIPSEPTWYQFHFDPPIPLIPGKTYYIAVSADSEYIYWHYRDGDYYTRGDAWMNGSGASIDWAFKTEYYVGCSSGIENIYWRYEWNGTSYPLPDHPAAVNGSLLSDKPEIANYWWYVYNESTGIHFAEECRHDLYYFAKDKVCHNSTVHHQVYYVDASEPIIEEILPEHGAIGNATRSLFEHFYVTFDNWTVVNGSTSYWDIYTEEPYFAYHYQPDKIYEGRYAALAWKYGGVADTWLISPRITIPVDGNLTFYYRTYWTYNARFEVCINNVTEEPDTSAFIPIWDSGIFSDITWRRVEIDLSKYAGQQVYIAFHCTYLEKDYYEGGLIIDKVWIGGIHRIALLIDDNVEDAYPWVREDLTVNDSYWRQVNRIPVYYNASPAPSMWCGDPDLGPGAGTFGRYGCNWDDTLKLKNPLDLSTLSPSDTLTLEFWRWNDFESGDVLKVEASIDGNNWTALVTIAGYTTNWMKYTIDISDYIGNDTFWIRFRFVSDDDDSNDNGVFIDNVSIYTPTQYVLPLQTFDDPWQNWTKEMLPTSKWHVTDYKYHSFNHSWWCGDESTHQYLKNLNDALMTEVNLSLPAYAGKQAMLTFWHWRDMGSGDYGYVEVSDDGGETWYQEASYSGSHDWIQEFIDLSSYIGEDILLRFRFYSNNDDTNNGWYIDDIRLEIREITETTFEDDFEKAFPPEGWTRQGYGGGICEWERYQTPEFSYAAIHGCSGSQQEKLISPVIHLPKFSNLTFKHIFQDYNGYANAYVYVINDTGEHLLKAFYSSTSGIVDLSLWKYHDQDIQIEFRFTTSKYYGNIFDYWAIEWVNITSIGFLRSCAPIILNATDMPINECRVGISAIYWRYVVDGMEHPDYNEGKVVHGSEIPGITPEDEEIYDYYWWVVYDNDENDTDDRIGYVSAEIHLPEECIHDIYYFAKDLVCHSSMLHHERWYVDGTPPKTWLNISWGDHPWIPKNDEIGLGPYAPEDHKPDVICIYDDIELIANHTGKKPCIYPYNWQNATYYRWVWFNESSYEYEFYPTPETPGAINGSEIVGKDNPYYDEIAYNDNYDFWFYQTPPFDGWIYWMKYEGPFYFEHECEHWLYYFSKDDLCNTEEPNVWHVGVDDSPPTSNIEFKVSNGTVYYNEENDMYYFQNCTWFIINTTDMPSEPCQTGIWYVDYVVMRWITNEVEIRLLTNQIGYETVYIDGEEAGEIISWIDSDDNDKWNYCDYMYIEWKGSYSNLYNDGWYHVEEVNYLGIWVLRVRGVFGDAGYWEQLIPWTRVYSYDLSSPYEGIEYHGGYDEGYLAIWIHLGELLYNRTGEWNVCGKYQIHWKVYDYNNLTIGEETQDVAIDCTPPRTTKEIKPCIEEIIAGGETIHWVNETTKIWLNGTDNFIWDSGVKETWYQFLGEKPILLWKYGVNEFEQPYYPGIYSTSKHWFTIEEAVRIILNDTDATVEDYFNARPGLTRCKIELYHWSVDNVSHVEADKHKQHLYVDYMSPASRVADIIPYNQTEMIFNITVTNITDYGCNVTGAVGICKVEVYYMYSPDNITWPENWTFYAVNESIIQNPDGSYKDWTLSFTAEQAGWYRFISIAYDCVGNKEKPPFAHGAYDAECCVMPDTEPPIITKEYGEPNIAIEIDGEIVHIITSNTKIYLNATDMPEEDYIGIDKIYWRFNETMAWYSTASYDGSKTANHSFTPSPFGLAEGVLYHLFYKSTDLFQHESEEGKQKFVIDDSHPITSIIIEGIDSLSFENRTFNVTINANDAIAGVKKVILYFRYSQDGNTWTQWIKYDEMEWSLAERQNNRSVTFEFIYNPTNGYYKPGYYEFYAYAEDYLGNAKDIPTVTTDAEASCYIEAWPEDFNKDGHVSIEDFLLVVLNWGKNENSPDWDEVQQYDLDGNKEIGLGDVIAIVTKWTG